MLDQLEPNQHPNHRVPAAIGYAGMLIWSLVFIQALARLVVIYQQSRGSIIVISLHITLIGGVSAAVLGLMAATRDRSALRFAAALIAAVGIMCLTVFDLMTFVTRQAINKDLPLATLSDFYCGNEGILACPRYQPEVAIALAIAACALATLIWADSGRLVAGTRRLARVILRVKLGIAIVAVLTGCLVLGASALNRGGNQWTKSEPVSKFFTNKAPSPGPGALLRGLRNDAPIERAATLTPRPIILIVADALRADGVGLMPSQPTDTPFLRSLAQSGYLYDLGPATAACDMSYCGITAIHGSADWAMMERGRPTMLADVLAVNGFESHFLLSGQHKNALNLKFIYGPNFTSFQDDSTADAAGFADDRDQIKRLASLKLRNPNRSFIAFHLMSTHNAAWLGEENDLAGLKRLMLSTRNNPARYAEVYRQRVRQLDNRLRAIFGILKQRGFLEDALIILTADHGERLNQKYGRLGHGFGIDPDTARIPLLIYDQRSNAWKQSPHASQIDIAPTLLAAIGARAPWTWQGKPLQRQFVRAGAPIDTIDRLAVMIQNSNGGAMVRCRLANGAIDVIRFGTAPAADDRTLIGQAKASRNGTAQRPGAARCFGKTN